MVLKNMFFLISSSLFLNQCKNIIPDSFLTHKMSEDEYNDLCFTTRIYYCLGEFVGDLKANGSMNLWSLTRCDHRINHVTTTPRLQVLF